MIDKRDKTAALKCIDHWFGGPLCVLLGVLHRITHPLYKTYPAVMFRGKPRSILVIKFFGLGSIILSSALIRNIRASYPGAEVIFLTFRENADLVRMVDPAVTIMAVDKAGIVPFIRSSVSALWYFSFHKPAISIDLEFYSKFTTIMAYLSGARWRIGFYAARFWRNSLVNVPVFFNYARHILEIYGMVGEAAGAKADMLYPSPVANGGAAPSARELLASRGVGEGSFVLGVNVNASDLAHCRRWPRERFAGVISALLREHDRLTVVMTGSPGEKAYTASVAALIDAGVRGRVVDLAGEISFSGFLALLKEFDLYLTNDSGPFHLAKAQGTPTVSLWGPGSPDLYGPYGREREGHSVVYKRWPCSPCLYVYRTDAGYFCRGAAPCLDAIAVADVVQAVNKAMARCSKAT